MKKWDGGKGDVKIQDLLTKLIGVDLIGPKVKQWHVEDVQLDGAPMKQKHYQCLIGVGNFNLLLYVFIIV